jgi:hypothetical protein|tara:strand:- start:108 stop:212 length:105 start_codon:yes stop_codon:yes gene_type:complete
MVFFFYLAVGIVLIVLAIAKYNERQNDDFDKRSN